MRRPFRRTRGPGWAAVLVPALLAGCTGGTPEAPEAPFVALPAGTFEDGVADWRPDDAFSRMRRTQQSPHGGDNALSVFAAGGGSAAVVSRRPIVASTRAGTSYAVRVFARAGTDEAGAYVELEETAPDGAVRGSALRRVTGGGQWQEVVVVLRSIRDGSSITLRLGADDAGAVSGVDFDDVAVRGADAAATSSPSPTTGPGSMLVGSNAYAGRAQSYRQAVRRQEAKFGRLQMLRTFYDSLPAPWPGDAGVTGLPVLVSFKGDPTEITSGVHDEQLRGWFADAPRDRDVYWTFFHEPENEVALGHFTEQQFRDAWVHIDRLAGQAGNERLRATLVLTCWTLQPASGRDWRDYYPGDDAVDVLGWDCYNTDAQRGQYITPERMFAAADDAADSVGKPWGVAEFGSVLAAGDDGTGRAAWLSDSVDWLRERGAAFVLYFDAPVGGDFRLRDARSVAAWRAAVGGD